MADLIDRQAAIDALKRAEAITKAFGYHNVIDAIRELSSVQPEPLTDKEQRIFLSAMSREEKVCREADRNYMHKPQEESLVRICHEIIRKVKGALWT